MKEKYYFKFENDNGHTIIVPVFFEKFGDWLKKVKGLKFGDYFCTEMCLPFGLKIDGRLATYENVKRIVLFLQHDINMKFLEYLVEDDTSNNKNFFYYRSVVVLCVEELKNQGKWVELHRLIDLYESWK